MTAVLDLSGYGRIQDEKDRLEVKNVGSEYRTCWFPVFKLSDYSCDQHQSNAGLKMDFLAVFGQVFEWHLETGPK